MPGKALGESYIADHRMRYRVEVYSRRCGVSEMSFFAHHVRRRFPHDALVEAYLGPRIGWCLAMIDTKVDAAKLEAEERANKVRSTAKLLSPSPATTRFSKITPERGTVESGIGSSFESDFDSDLDDSEDQNDTGCRGNGNASTGESGHEGSGNGDGSPGSWAHTGAAEAAEYTVSAITEWGGPVVPRDTFPRSPDRHSYTRTVRRGSVAGFASLSPASGVEVSQFVLPSADDGDNGDEYDVDDDDEECDLGSPCIEEDGIRLDFGSARPRPGGPGDPSDGDIEEAEWWAECVDMLCELVAVRLAPKAGKGSPDPSLQVVPYHALRRVTDIEM